MYVYIKQHEKIKKKEKKKEKKEEKNQERERERGGECCSASNCLVEFVIPWQNDLTGQ